MLTDSCVIGTESIVRADYWDGSPMVVGPGGQLPPPTADLARLTIDLTSGSTIKLEGASASTIWHQLKMLAALYPTLTARKEL